MSISRREFLVSSSIFALTAGRVSARRKKTVLVLGAGLSGLASAIELSRKGFEVTVIEARERVGGRIFTLRKPFSDGLFTETGGELIGDGYERLLGYADQFGIKYAELRPEAETGGSVSEIQDGIGRNAYMKGRFFRKGNVIQKHPYGLRGDESRLLPPTLLGKYLRLMNNDVRQGKTTLAALDRVSLGQELRSRGASKKAVGLMDISLNYNSIYTVSAAGVLNDGIKRRSAGTLPLRLEGGNDRLTAAMQKAAQEDGARFVLGNEIKRIDHDAGKVGVHAVAGDGTKQVFNADKIVCTIPFSVLRKIRFYPSLDETKRRVIENLDYTRMTKVYFQAKFAEWDKRSLGSSIWTDTSIERIFSTTGKTGDERGLFTIWTEGRGSRKLEKMNPPARKAYAADRFQKVLPFMKGSVERTDTLSWSLDPYARGAYSHLKVGQLSSLQPHIGTPVGNIHFAGEHTAIKMPGMEGALESAERVIKEIAG